MDLNHGSRQPGKGASVQAASADERTRDWLGSGVVALTGRPGREALVPRGTGATWARRMGELLDKSGQFDEPVDGAALLGERAALTGWTSNGSVSIGGRTRLLPTADGWMALSCARPDDHLLIGAMVGQRVDVDPWQAVAQWASTRTQPEIDSRIELLGVAGGCVRSEPLPSPELPTKLRSVRGATVVDFSALWAGPLCAHMLGAAGAHVIKVETPHRPDGARFGETRFYDLLHAGHESVVLDPGIAHERDILRRLVDSADIVIEASRPRALAGFGLDAGRVAERGRTWISITAYGRRSNRVGFGDDVAAARGLLAWDPEGGVPLFAGDAIADPLTGLRAALCALDQSNSGVGKLWDIAMAETVASTIGCEVDDPNVPADAVIGVPRHRPLRGSAPRMGEHTVRVLRRLGVDE